MRQRVLRFGSTILPMLVGLGLIGFALANGGAR